ncbi:hypothetical protein ACDL92_03080 [Ihubacter sp. mB4P-1]|uniref:hypothetical protein n=1 Tax=Ihubacter sp. mB4P-1 TaxID=3242370 RepID=UPI003C7ECF4D
MIEERNMRLIIVKAGGTAGKNSLTYKISLPSKWVKEMGFSLDDRNAVIAFDGEQITIRKRTTED